MRFEDALEEIKRCRGGLEKANNVKLAVEQLFRVWNFQQRLAHQRYEMILLTINAQERDLEQRMNAIE